MTESNWTTYKDSAGKAAFALGAVPFEMYINSIKHTQSKDWYYQWINYGYYLSGTGTNGNNTTNDTVTTSMSNGIYQLSNYRVKLAGPSVSGGDYLYNAEDTHLGDSTDWSRPCASPRSCHSA